MRDRETDVLGLNCKYDKSAQKKLRPNSPRNYFCFIFGRTKIKLKYDKSVQQKLGSNSPRNYFFNFTPCNFKKFVSYVDVTDSKRPFSYILNGTITENYEGNLKLNEILTVIFKGKFQ
jgi:hypothetical protein